MKIFLLETIDNVGRIGDSVDVKPGYARNYLIPKGKAALATPENVARFEELRAELEKKAQTEVEAARARAQMIEGKVIRIAARAGSEGKLFGSVGTIDIAAACEALGVKVERSRIRMPDGPLRLVGEHMIELHLHAEVDVPLKVVVESSEAVEAAADADKSADSPDSGDAGTATGGEEGHDELDPA